LLQAALEELWHQLPDILEDRSSQQVDPLPSPTLPLPITLLCARACIADKDWGTLQAPLFIDNDTESIIVYSDGSLQGEGSGKCCGSAGIIVLDRDKSL